MAPSKCKKIICDQSFLNLSGNRTNLLIIGSLEERKCRTCLLNIDDDANFTRLNDKIIIGSNNQVTTVEMINLLTSLQLTEEDEYPQEICGDCFEKLTNAYIFRIQCITTDSIIKNMTYKIAASTPKHCGKDSNTFDSINIADDIFPSTLETTNLKDITRLTEQLNSLDKNIECFTSFNIQENVQSLTSNNQLHSETSLRMEFTRKEYNEKHNMPVENYKGIEEFKENLSKENHQLIYREKLQANVKCNKSNLTDSVDAAETQKHIGEEIYVKRQHKKLQCKKMKSFICHVCGLTFKSNGILRKHVMRHSERKDFKCSICIKAFSLADDLRKHALIHNARNYICEICAASFTRKDTLNMHKKTHFNIKPHSCPHCSKRFLNSYNLQNHVRTHLKLMPYVCCTCNKVFTQKTSLVRHMRIHKKTIN